MCKHCNYIQKTQFANQSDGDLRLWWIPQVPMEPFYWKVETPTEAGKLLDMLAQYDLFQFEHKVKPDFSNVGGLESCEDGEWIDWYSGDGDDFDDWWEEQKENGGKK